MHKKAVKGMGGGEASDVQKTVREMAEALPSQ